MDQNINKEGILVPTLLLQPVVENAVIHGMAGANGNGKISIYIKQLNSNLNVRIVDNGPGIISNTTDSKGYGNKIITERIKLLNQKKARQIKFSLERDIRVQETNAIFQFPINYK